MADIFISYSRKDRDRVAPLADALEAAGFSIWWDTRIATGADFDDEIEQAITASRAILVVWSLDSIASRWVKEEAEDGLQRSCLVPVLIDPVVPPRGFRRIQAADFTAAKFVSGDDVFDRLCVELRRLVDGRAQDSDGNARPDQGTAYRPKLDRRRFVAWSGIAGVGVIATGAGLWQSDFFGERALPPPADMTPTVIGIYPSDAFGPLQKRGLHLALETAARGTSLVDLQAPLDAMKRQDVPKLVETLIALLRDRNVISIVGPSVTELAPVVIETVEQSGRKPAIFLTTAGPRAAIGWEGSPLPIFRVGSGVDERAKQFANLATRAIAKGRKIVFLVEQTLNESGLSYGELFFQAISAFLPDWKKWVADGRISRINYERGNAIESLRELEKEEIFDGNNLVLLLGLGGDFKALAEHYFSASLQPRKSVLGSWMTSYAMQPVFEEKPLQTAQLFDISDVFGANPGALNDPIIQPFTREFGPLTPARRDEAISYDCGVVIAAAIEASQSELTAETLVEFVRGTTHQGISGLIRFGKNGQNTGPAGGTTPLIIVQFDPANRTWRKRREVDIID